jgi:hypothetical protein
VLSNWDAEPLPTSSENTVPEEPRSWVCECMQRDRLKVECWILEVVLAVRSRFHTDSCRLLKRTLGLTRCPGRAWEGTEGVWRRRGLYLGAFSHRVSFVCSMQFHYISEDWLDLELVDVCQMSYRARLPSVYCRAARAEHSRYSPPHSPTS